ncbi:hypothetical protein L484_023979 [Morus notabilis]|uniref:Uncharacterized protein n=1 Tax=Morus notabilis TaxID=981085 RepID=W9R0G8_9ROSA|nr:hypothetical protein L484_023979 [Morus notabilis]
MTYKEVTKVVCSRDQELVKGERNVNLMALLLNFMLLGEQQSSKIKAIININSGHSNINSGNHQHKQRPIINCPSLIDGNRKWGIKSLTSAELGGGGRASLAEADVQAVAEADVRAWRKRTCERRLPARASFTVRCGRASSGGNAIEDDGGERRRLGLP